ncbi:MAG: DUF1549 domain-containing protein, partial [Planctomycetales bacterium]|nr:DUF1549 domain-containing protein [Planctomycetales bacterium]
WLDAVRYGDTHGLHLDNRRGIYPYRDWVVRAFNEGLPLDEFIRWQVAGDLMPDPTLEQMIATGFVRMNPTTSEGGAIPDEFQAKNNFDRTEAIGTVLLGMTLTCARCHSHKYDPITQTEYYQLLAFFNSTAEPPLDSNAYAFGPTVETPADQPSWYAWERLEQESRQLLEPVVATADGNAEMIEYARTAAGWTSGQWQISQPIAADAAGPADDQWQGTDKLPGKAEQRLPANDQAIWVACDLNLPRAQSLWLSYRAGTQETLWIDDVAVEGAVAGAAGGWKLHRVELKEGTHRLRLKLVGDGSNAPVELALESPWQKLAQTGSWRQCSTEDQLLLVSDPVSPALPEAQLQAMELTLARRVARQSFTTTLVARELPNPRPTRLLRRGEYDLPVGDPVSPGVPAAIGGWPQDAPQNRLGLASWLTSAENPLVTRVLINSLWQRTFGHGLVRTPEDFGLQGDQPTHPELLDWLAA